MITHLTDDVNAIKDTAFKNAAQVLVDKFKALSKAVALELGVADASSAILFSKKMSMNGRKESCVYYNLLGKNMETSPKAGRRNSAISLIKQEAQEVYSNGRRFDSVLKYANLKLEEYSRTIPTVSQADILNAKDELRELAIKINLQMRRQIKKSAEEYLEKKAYIYD